MGKGTRKTEIINRALGTDGKVCQKNPYSNIKILTGINVYSRTYPDQCTHQKWDNCDGFELPASCSHRCKLSCCCVVECSTDELCCCRRHLTFHQNLKTTT